MQDLVAVDGKPTRIVRTEEYRLGYIVSYPHDYRPGGEPLPVLCFLHGDGEAAPMDIVEAMRRHGPLKGGQAAAAADRFIVVAPQLPALRRGDNWAEYAAAVRDIVAAVPGRDPGRTYLTGFSYGGNGVLSIAAAPATPKGFWA